MTPPTVIQGAHSQSTHELQGVIEELGRRIGSLARDRADLTRELRQASGDERSVIQARVQEVDANMAVTQAQLSEVAGKLAQAKVDEAFAGSLVPPPPPPDLPRSPWIDPDAITAAFLMLSIGVIVPLSIGLTRRLWRRPAPAAPAPEVEAVSKARFDRLEQAVDAIAIEIERISEGQRFVTRVLSERPSSVRPSAPAIDANDAALGEAKPFLALGAGPVEAIPIPQRQSVKQSITPH